MRIRKHPSKLSHFYLLFLNLLKIHARFARFSAIGIFLLIAPYCCYAQGGKCATSKEVGCVIPNLFGVQGLILPNRFHSAHFLSDFQQNFSPLNTAIATQLTLLPIPSLASGFTYTFDRGAGVYTRSAQSFGPILTERAETIGQKKILFGSTYQRFRFDSLDGQDLKSIPVVFEHSHDEINNQPNGRPADFEEDYITSTNRLDFKIDQFMVFGTVGLTNWLDVSLAVPILNVSMAATSNATINRLAGPVTLPSGQVVQSHFFDPNDPVGSTKATFSGNSSASGIGDITVRLKGGVYRGKHLSMALLTDIRVPTGKERDFLGSGAVGIKPFVAISFASNRFAPHVNLGYQWNGKSTLAGNLDTGAEGDLPNLFFYSAGTDIGVTKSLTVAVDLIGQRVGSIPRLYSSTFTAANGGKGPNIGFRTESYLINNLSTGFKYNIAGQLLLTGNLLIQLDDGGLRQRIVPLIGLSYAF
ncbi:MAG: transporter [Bryobacteraceae bacterium]|nr:transporter [Bryobacteraceae bacterium]